MDEDLTQEEWTKLLSMVSGYFHTQTLATACELDLFSFLSKKPGATQAEIGEAIGLSAYSTRVFLLAACSIGIIHRDPATEGYKNSRIAEVALVKGRPKCAWSYTQFTNRVFQRQGLHFTQALKESRNVGLEKEMPGEGPGVYVRMRQYPELQKIFLDAMGFYSQLTPDLTEVKEFENVRNLLDMAGGDGTKAILNCQRYPNMKVTHFDLPQVSEIARKRVESQGLSDRIKLVSGDMFSDPWPQGHDTILMSNLAEIFSEERVKLLYKKAAEALPPGGTLIVWCNTPDDLETGGIEVARLSAFFLYCASGEGRTYSAKQHIEMMREAGFASARSLECKKVISNSAIIGVK